MGFLSFPISFRSYNCSQDKDCTSLLARCINLVRSYSEGLDINIMRTIEVVEQLGVSRGRYARTNADGGDIEFADNSPTGSKSSRSSRRSRIDDLALGDDDDSVAGESLGGDLESQLEREVTRRAVRRTAKRCVVVALVLGVALALAVKSGKLSFTSSPARSQPWDDDHGPDDVLIESDDEFPALDETETTGSGGDDHGEEVETVVEGQEEIEDLSKYFNMQKALPPYKICPPPIKRDRKTQEGYAVFHIGDFRTVPVSLTCVMYLFCLLWQFNLCHCMLLLLTYIINSAFVLVYMTNSSQEEDESESEDSWEYTLSDMDVSADASIIAVGFGDYAADTDYAVGMVRVFAYSCKDQKFQRLGQDLLGNHTYEMFGHRVSSSGDGKVLAISAPQGDYDGGNGFVQVVALDEDTGRWEQLGKRIEDVDGDVSEYYMLGHAVDISDDGQTLAVLGIVDDENDNPSYVTRVFDYDYRNKEWARKGHDLVIENVTYGTSYEYNPQVSLSDEGKSLVVTDPQMGVVKCKLFSFKSALGLHILPVLKLTLSSLVHPKDHFHFSFNRWKRQESRTPKWNDMSESGDEDYWIESLDLDDRGTLVAFSAYEEGSDGTIANGMKVVDFEQNATVPVDVYTRDFRGWSVGLSVAVSDKGNVAALVASKIDMDDSNWWVEYDYGEDVVGALTVVTKFEGDDLWTVVGEGTEASNLGVSGSKVSLSGDGLIAAVGYDTVISLYGISLVRSDTISAEAEAEAKAEEEEDAVVASEGVDDTTRVGAITTMSDICAPFPDADSNGPLGSIDDLPQMKEGDEQHTLSLALSEDGSIVAVGIDSFDGEDRGIVRTFAWSCDEGKYLRLGEDLLGLHEFDGFGQSVDLSKDGKTLAVGANQPPPGKTGYVDVFKLEVDDWNIPNWKIKGHRIHEFPKDVSDMGREVRLSDDGNILMILGSIMKDGEDYDSSFLRVMRMKNNKWVAMGNDILSSIDYDDYGTSAHAALSRDGTHVIITGSYSQFIAKLYQFGKESSSWAETIVPPLSCDDEDTEELSEDLEGDDNFDDDEWDYAYECYFTGADIAVSTGFTFIAVAGTSYTNSGEEIGVVRVLTKDANTGNYTLFEDPIDFARPDDYYISSVDISGDGQHLAVGINVHMDDLDDQGTLFVTQNTGENWATVGKVDGRNETDLLGARVRITRNGRLAAASSRRGYVSFFGTDLISTN